VTVRHHPGRRLPFNGTSFLAFLAAAEAGPEFAPGYLDTMSGWLVERFAPKR
jgi:hypothetical protein